MIPTIFILHSNQCHRLRPIEPFSPSTLTPQPPIPSWNSWTTALPNDRGRLLNGRNGCPQAIIGHGDVPIAQCLGIMKRAGYDGVLSIEFEGLEDPIRGLEIGLENLRRYVDQAK